MAPLTIRHRRSRLNVYHPVAWHRGRDRLERSGAMTTRSVLGLAAAAVAIAVLGAGSMVRLDAQQPGAGAVPIDGDDIGGVVTGPSGPEAGVWVIAETTELPTKFARIVVTDDQGRYVVPDLPKAKYTVWVRGYGLVDSAKVDAEPGKQLNLRAVPAANDAAAAQYYPAIYWYSMMKIPDADQFGGKSDIPANISQSDWLTVVKNRACVGCHQLGQLSTRTIPASLGQFDSGQSAWIRRVQSGQAATFMLNPLTQQLGSAPFKYFCDWTDRVAKGELPHTKPPRPQGVERNIVVTTWEWGDPKKYLHDLIASDRRYPTVNAYGKLYGSPEYATDDYPILDPKTNTVTTFRAPVRDADTPEALGPGHAALEKPMAPSPYWGDEKLWDTKANNHNGLIDKKGRVWFAAAVRGPKNPDFCQKGSDHPSAKLFPLERTNRALTYLDPNTYFIVFGSRYVSARFVLPDASSPVRLRRQRHAVVQRRRPGDRLGQHQNVRRDRRRGEVTGLDGVRAGHQRQRQARRVRRARSAGRSDEGQAHRRRLLRGDAEPGRRLRSGRAARTGIESAGDGARGDLQRAQAVLRHPRRRHR